MADNKQVEKIQDRALRYVLCDFNDTYCNLLQRASKSTLYLSRLRILAIEIFKVINDMSPLYMKSLFIKKCIAYELRDFVPLIQPKFNTITYGHNTIKYQGSKIWNNLSNNLKNVKWAIIFQEINTEMVWTRVSLWVLCAVHFGTYIMPLYISFLFIHNHIGQKLFLACVFCYFKTNVK